MKHLAAELNDLGVACIERGDLQGALGLLRDSLKCALATISAFADDPVKVQIRSRHSALLQSSINSTPCPCVPSKYGETMAPGENVGGISGHQKLLVEYSTAFMHRHGISLISRSGKFFSDSDNNYVVSTIITFNIALTYHLEGVKNACSSVNKLEIARSLYLESWSIINKANISFVAPKKDGLPDLLLLALYNNLAEVNFELLRYNESRSFFSQLVKYGRTIQPNSYRDSHVYNSLQQLKSSLLMNAIMLHAPTIAPAA